MSVAQWIEPTPLPFAPESVLGIVSIQGRMFTVIDLGRLTQQPATEPSEFIVALRGDEQLALAVSEATEVADLPVEQNGNSKLLHPTIGPNNREVSLLNKSMLFASVLRGRERRQRTL